MKLFSSFFVIMIALIIIPVSNAETYMNVTATRVSIKSGIGKAKPYAATVKLGYRFSESLAVEAQYGSNASDDGLSGGKVEVDKLTALFLRMGGNSSYNGVRTYLLLGTSKTDIKYTGVPVPGEGSIEGTAWGIGAEEFSKSVRNMAYVLEYLQYADEKDTKIMGLSLGVRYNF